MPNPDRRKAIPTGTDERTPLVAAMLHADQGYGREVLEGICDYIQENRSFMAIPAGEVFDHPERLTWWLGRADAVITEARTPEHVRALAANGLPAVIVTGRIVPESLPCVIVDNAAVGRMAAEFYLDRGFSDFAYAGYPHAWFSQVRSASFQETVLARGKRFHPFDQKDPAWSEYPDPELIRWLIDLPKPVGLLAANVHRAQEAILACRSANLAVPEDIAVLGVDRDEILCDMVSPPMSFVDPGTQQIGRRAAAIIDDLLSGRPAPDEPVIIQPVGIQERQSTDCFAVSDPAVRTALMLIRRRAFDGLTVEEVTREVGLSRRSLEMKFKRLLSRTLQQEILRVRLDRGKLLLTETSLDLPDLAVRCGFSSASYFGQAFHRHFGLSPTQFRAQTLGF